jgi:hypothetical protein
MAEGAPISVTSVKPATINTPFFNNSRNKMDVKPMGPPPFYEPSVVADCVLYAAEHPVRDLFAGGAGKMMALGQMLAPKLVDATLARAGIASERTDEPQPGGSRGNLDAPREDDDRTEGDFSSRARRFSLYTWMETHPGAKALAAGGILAGTAVLIARRRRNASRKATDRAALPWQARGRAPTRDAQIREHMVVIGSDGERVGIVDHVDGRRLKLAKNDPVAGGAPLHSS